MDSIKDTKLTDEEILSMLSVELSNSAGDDDSIERNRRNALAAYLGDKGKEIDGHSSVVSTDVADAIEWIMPELMKTFTQNNEVVVFDPLGNDDRRQAEIESRFVYDTIMKNNDGFILLHEFFKDALMQKNGIIKCYYSDQTEITKENYTGLTEPEVYIVQSNPDVQITGLTEIISEGGQGSISLYDINITRTKTAGSVKMYCVPPENFRVNSMHNSVSLKDARFCGEIMIKTRSELLEDGFDKDIVDSLRCGIWTVDENKNYRFSAQGEDTFTRDKTTDRSQDLIEIIEGYMLIDIDGDGISERVKITAAGGDNPTDLLEIEEIDCNPYIGATSILMSHKFFGLSIYDRLKEIQDQKTALWRNILDNLYLINNQQKLVLEGQVNLDDLLISRPGGIIRQASKGAVEALPQGQIPNDTYKMFDYLDSVRAGRAGVSPEGSIHDSAMGDSVGSQGLEQLLNQKEELVGLMVRLLAETGVKPLCEMIRSLLVKHHDVIEDYEFHDEWVKINPTEWKTRTRSTVRVGTGSGNRKEQAASILQILGFQEKILSRADQSLVTEQQIYDALNDYAKFTGMPGVGAYFLDPASPQGQKNKERVIKMVSQKKQMELKEKEQLAQAQIKIANAEESKARTAEQNVTLRHQSEMLRIQFESYKQSMDNKISQLEQSLAEYKAMDDESYKKADIATRKYQIDRQSELKDKELNLKYKGGNDGQDREIANGSSDIE